MAVADADAPARLAELEALAPSVAGCTRCRLAEGRNKVVFGSGNPDADLMLIGEGPGAEEDRQGLPFVGAAGELLTKIIQAIELTPRRRLHRQRRQVPAAGQPRSRSPTRSRPAAAILEQQIDAGAAQGHRGAGPDRGPDPARQREPDRPLRGRWYQVRGIPTMVTYHPAALLRNPA